MAKKPKPRLWGVDTEDDGNGKVDLINFYDGVNHYTFTDQQAAIDFMLELKGENHFWACNMAYDIGNLFKKHLTCLEMRYVKSRFISAKMLSSKNRFYCTLNHWKMSVEEMGKRIGLAKLKVDGKFNDVAYCRRDTEIVFKFVKEMRKKYYSVGAVLKPTIGSTALNLFVNNYSNQHTPKNIFEIEELEFMKHAMYGGRTEVFFNAPVKGRIYAYDFNSMYPAVMKKYPYPVLTSREWTDKPNFEREGVVYARVFCPNLFIPYLPYRLESLYFPSGEFDTYTTYFEIREALKLGYKIQKVYRALEFTAGTFHPFEGFVTDIYGQRLRDQEKNDVLGSETCKLILNNVFGKYAQNNKKTSVVPVTEKLLLSHNCVLLDEDMALVTKLGDYPPHTNYIWSAYTTAYGRHELFSGLLHADKSAKVLYCDTDSIYALSDKPVFEKSKALGELKLEGIFSYAHFRGLKTYHLKMAEGSEVFKIRGIPKAHAKEFFETGKATFRKPRRLREVLYTNRPEHNGKKREKRSGHVINAWDEVTKTDQKTYDKRKVLKNGETKPIRVTPAHKG